MHNGDGKPMDFNKNEKIKIKHQELIMKQKVCL